MLAIFLAFLQICKLWVYHKHIQISHQLSLQWHTKLGSISQILRVILYVSFFVSCVAEECLEGYIFSFFSSRKENIPCYQVYDNSVQYDHTKKKKGNESVAWIDQQLADSDFSLPSLGSYASLTYYYFYGDSSRKYIWHFFLFWNM